MSGPLHVSKIQCYQGVDLEETRAFFDQPASGTDLQNSVPVDFTGATARMMVRLERDPASTQVLSLTVGAGLEWVTETFTGGPALPSAANGIELTITRVQSLAMNGGVPFVGGYYDLLVDTAGGTTIHLMAGQFDLMPTVTR
jgi:hypothetical protein